MKGLSVVILLMIASVLQAQNLVPNPGFEAFFKCPVHYTATSTDFLLPGWNSASTGTPDHFHSCSNAESSVPKNWAGAATPHSGNGYAGLYVWGRNGKSYREYIQCKLTEPLQAGKEYHISFFFKLSSYSKYKTDRIGLLLIDSVLHLARDKVFRVIPTLSVVQTPTEEGEWDYAKMIYKARGGETNLIIGNFYDDHNTENVRLDYRTIKNAMLSTIAYFYIDDVSVIPADQVTADSVIRPLPTTAEKDEIYSPGNIQFEFNSYQLIPNYFPELDRLVAILKEKPHWNIELTGHTDDVGSEAYNYDLSRSRALHVSEYLKSKGITPARITTSGLGETMLLATGTDETSRTINRRVEVQFVEHQMEK